HAIALGDRGYRALSARRKSDHAGRGDPFPRRRSETRARLVRGALRRREGERPHLPALAHALSASGFQVSSSGKLYALPLVILALAAGTFVASSNRDGGEEYKEGGRSELRETDPVVNEARTAL